MRWAHDVRSRVSAGESSGDEVSAPLDTPDTRDGGGVEDVLTDVPAHGGERVDVPVETPAARLVGDVRDGTGRAWAATQRHTAPAWAATTRWSRAAWATTRHGSAAAWTTLTRWASAGWAATRRHTATAWAATCRHTATAWAAIRRGSAAAWATLTRWARTAWSGTRRGARVGALAVAAAAVATWEAAGRAGRAIAGTARRGGRRAAGATSHLGRRVGSEVVGDARAVAATATAARRHLRPEPEVDDEVADADYEIDALYSGADLEDPAGNGHGNGSTVERRTSPDPGGRPPDTHEAAAAASAETAVLASVATLAGPPNGGPANSGPATGGNGGESDDTLVGRPPQAAATEITAAAGDRGARAAVPDAPTPPSPAWSPTNTGVLLSPARPGDGGEMGSSSRCGSHSARGCAPSPGSSS